MAENDNNHRRVAIACQGGGSHTAFTAGALNKLLTEMPDKYEVVALSGTSGGAICALLAWCALLEKGLKEALKELYFFWKEDNSASFKFNDIFGSSVDYLLDRSVQASSSLTKLAESVSGMGYETRFNPYAAHWTLFNPVNNYPGNRYYRPFQPAADSSRDRLERAIENRLKRIAKINGLRDVDQKTIDQIIEELVSGRVSPQLFIGAANPITGEFKVFRSHRPHDESSVFNTSAYDRLSVEAVLASATIPTIFRAMRTGKATYWKGPQGPKTPPCLAEGVYWDGLYSSNPPIRQLADANPDEIWVIQINPEETEIGKKPEEPKTSADIDDRHNELAGNLSLNQELAFIRERNALIREKNELIREYQIPKDTINTIKVRRFELPKKLDSSSKLARDPEHIGDLIRVGENQAGDFLKALAIQSALEETWDHAKALWESERVEESIEVVVDLFTEQAEIKLVPPVGASAQEKSKGKDRSEEDNIRKWVEWCLDRNLNIEQVRNYRVDGKITWWMLVTLDGFHEPVKGWTEVNMQDNKISYFAFCPLDGGTVERLEAHF